MEGTKNDIDQIGKVLEKLQDELSDLSNKLEECDLDLYLDKSYTDLIVGEKLTKKQRREKAIEMAKKKFPNLVKNLEIISLATEGLSELLDDKVCRLQDALDKIQEVEDLKEEIQRELD